MTTATHPAQRSMTVASRVGWDRLFPELKTGLKAAAVRLFRCRSSAS